MKPLTAEAAPKPAKRGSLRIQRAARRKAYYAMQPARTAANKKRTLARHIRHYPEDEQAKLRFVALYREAALASHLVNITGKAKQRETQRLRQRARLDSIKHRLAQDPERFVAPPDVYAPYAKAPPG